ncbi:uncharacterized protein BDR25DRAFT_341607 [Lindgomyces ingoldianus]|uniref:Uncharacterized protein n=1 Tax=Lindgomyces ingoldianus TaxID=673940 RepID=A0ACB6R117_9PLEO|nr:uncharacterized protein BDR25DRAFT_341607 [Lindgomyces ingoldianus]KAF2472742.1 hypothetical protein BDR25DRAFT_341607 [Lindgomyces ingoldianus]
MAMTGQIGVPSALTALTGPGWDFLDSDPSFPNPAQEAFRHAVRFFESNLTQDECKRIWLQEKTSLQDVQKAVQEAKEAYDSSKHSRPREWLSKLSYRVLFYGNILDVLSQHHPEYVSLAWGAIKFVFIGVLNHEELLHELSKALCYIADTLPHVELKAVLFPTPLMKTLVGTLYAHIINFVQRAVKWYKEGKIKHAITSITRPFRLRFQDLVDEIREASRKIDQLAASLSFAEQRRMHSRLQDTYAILEDMKRVMESYNALSQAHLIDTNRRVCEIQFSQILTFVHASPFESPEEIRHFYTSVRNRHRQRDKFYSGNLQATPGLRDFGTGPTSSQIIVSSSFRTRHLAKNFAVDVIDHLDSTETPVVWVLHKPPFDHGERKPITTIEVVKQLVYQILQKNPTLLSERSLSLNAVRFQSARTENDWFALLGSVLAGLKHLYIIVDTAIFNDIEEKQLAAIWLEHFRKLFKEIRNRASCTVVKVVFINYKPTFTQGLPEEYQDSVVRVSKRTVERSKEYRKLKRKHVRAKRLHVPEDTKD